MSNTYATETTAAPARSRATNVVLWVLQVLLAAQFAMAALPKLQGAEIMVDMFDDIGAGQWLRIVVGLLEVAGAIGLLIPRLTALAALGLVGLMAGAVITNAFVIETNPVIPILLLVVAAVIVWGRRPLFSSTSRS